MDQLIWFGAGGGEKIFGSGIPYPKIIFAAHVGNENNKIVELYPCGMGNS